MDEELYREIIIDHGQRPRNHGRLDAPTHSAVGDNPLCGDRVTIQLDVVDGIVRAARIEAVGCAISTASASLLAERIEGMPVAEVRDLFARVHTMVTQSSAPIEDDLDSLAALSVARRYPMRVKCATLAWHALMEALDD